jgi:uncharacterized protein (TIGR02246 family)
MDLVVHKERSMAELTIPDIVASLVDALNRGDLDSAVAHYDADATFIPQPGTVVVGREAIREALAAMLAARPRLVTHSHQHLCTGDVALYHSQWSMSGTAPDGGALELAGRSADVLRRDAGGAWRVQVDNPWGAAVLDA